jgi:hypothetical protein
MSQILFRNSTGSLKYPGKLAYGLSDSNRHLMSPVVGTKLVMLAKLANPYLLPCTLSFDLRVFHRDVTGSIPTFPH